MEKVATNFILGTTALGERATSDLVSCFRALFKVVTGEYEVEPLSTLLHNERSDIIAAISHFLPQGLFVVFRPIGPVDQERARQVASARVCEVHRDGGLSWRVGCPPDLNFRSGRDWRLDNEPLVSYKLDPSCVFSNEDAARDQLVQVQRGNFNHPFPHT